MPAPARAQVISTVVIPGRADVPVIINGFDASYCVVEGELGLGRPGHMSPSIVECPPYLRAPPRGSGPDYFPVRGRQPGYGRLEIEPPANRRKPPPARSFHREWSAGSDPLPASLDPPGDVGPIAVAPTYSGRRRPPLARRWPLVTGRSPGRQSTRPPGGGCIEEKTMLRQWMPALALSALACTTAVGPAAAGWYGYGCDWSCEQFYVVN